MICEMDNSIEKYSIMEYTGRMTKRVQTVAEVVQEMDLPPDQKKRHLEYLQDRQLSRALTVVRAQMGLSQTKAAKKLGWSQGRVSKLEMKADHDVSVGDLVDYAEAMGMQVAVTLSPGKEVKPAITNLTQISIKLVGRPKPSCNANGRKAFRRAVK